MPYIRRKPVERTCANCGATFMSNHARRKFCSDTCRVTKHYKKHGYPVYISRGRAESLADREQNEAVRIDEVLTELRAIHAELDQQKALTATVKDTLLNNMGSIVSIVQNIKQSKKTKEHQEELMNAFGMVMETLGGLAHAVNDVQGMMDVSNQNDGAFVHALNALHEDVQSAIEPKIKLRPWP